MISPVAVWSLYATLDIKLGFIRVGTLNTLSRRPPNVHIFTTTKRLWGILPRGSGAYPEFRSAADGGRIFGPARMARHEALIEEVIREAC